MGLLDRLNRKKEETNVDNAFMATPHFYSNSNKGIFGAIALTEGTSTILPLNPKDDYKVDGKIIDDWKMILVSTTLDKIIGEADYYSIIQKLETISCRKGKTIIVEALSLDKMKELIDK